MSNRSRFLKLTAFALAIELIVITTLLFTPRTLANSDYLPLNASKRTLQNMIPVSLQTDLSHRYVVFLAGITSSSPEEGPPLNNTFAFIQGKLRNEGISNFVYFSYGAAASLLVGDLYCSGWGTNGCQSTTTLGDLSSLSLSPVYSSEDTKLPIDSQVDALDWLLHQIVTHDPSAKIDLVTHSLGGIISSRWASRFGNSTLHDNIHSIVLIESPVGGIFAAKAIIETQFEGILWATIIKNFFGINVLRALQIPEDGVEGSIVLSLEDAARFFNVTSIQSTTDFLVNGTSLSIEGVGSVPFGLGSQNWITSHIRHHNMNLGGQDINSVPLSLDLKTLLQDNHSKPLNELQTANWVIETIIGNGDTTPPSGSWTAPSNGATVGTSVTLSGTATDDNSGVAYVQFTAWWQGGPDPDVWYVATTQTTPTSGNTYSYSWNLCAPVTLADGRLVTIPNGSISLGMDITDKAGNRALSPNGIRTITKNGTCSSQDTTLPTASWISPSRGATISSRTVNLSANASDNVGGSGVREVHFSALWSGSWHDVGVDTTAPYSVDWDWCAAGVPNGDVELGLEVWDNANNHWVYSEQVLAGNIHVTTNYNCNAIELPSWLLEWSTSEQPPLNVTIHARVQFTSDFDAFRVCIDGTSCSEQSGGNTEIFYNWNTYGWSDGYHTLSVEYRRKSDNLNWNTALRYTQQYYLSPNRNGTAPCDGGSGIILRSGSDCIRLVASQSDLGSIGWSDRGGLSVQVIGSYEAWVYDDNNFQGFTRVVHSGETQGVGGNVTSIQIRPPAPPVPTLPTQPFSCDSQTMFLYHFDENSGTVVSDACGRVNGINIGGSWTTGKFASAMSFSNPPDGQGVNFGATTDVCPITVEMLVRRRGPGRIAGQLGGNGNSGQNKWLLSFDDTKPKLEIWSAGGSRAATSYQAVTDTNWHLLAFTFDCVNSAVLYLDNAPVAYLTTDSRWSTGNTTFEIGASEGIYRFQGDIDEVRISGVVRDPQTNAERAALEALYNSTNGPNWVNHTGWMTSSYFCTWYGIYFDLNGRIMMIILPSNGLKGTLPPQIGDLSSLIQLNLHVNQLTGNIPSELGKLHLTYLDLARNQLTGSIPHELGNLSILFDLYLANNQLSGSIPPELGNIISLLDLDLSNNQLSGNIPPEFGNLSNLQNLTLHHNQLSGSIPPEFGNLSNLQNLYLAYNQLSGNIPPELGNLFNLHYLLLPSNHLAGNIPTTIGNLSQLYNLDLSFNQLFGEIPTSLGNLTGLNYLFLGNNQFTGSIPAEISSLTNLKRMEIQSNQFSGDIPNLSSLTNLEFINFSTNQLTGSFPSWFNSLPKLTHIDLFFNRLSGIIPYLGDMRNLDVLSLGSNQLTGEIPSWFSGMSNLSYLYLSGNQLSGAIPDVSNLTRLTVLGLGNNAQLTGQFPDLSRLTNLYWLDLSHTQLSGTIPSSLGNLTLLQTVYLNSNRLSGDIPVEFANLINLQSLDINFNMLTASSPVIKSFLDSKNPGWALTQTIPPANVHIGTITSTAIQIAWDAIPYVQDGGNYQVNYSTSASGPFDQIGCTTADKTVTNCIVESLIPNTSYYFAVRTFTPSHAGQTNSLLSDFGAVIAATTSQATNVQPTANAGIDQTITDLDSSGSELVTLDGSLSTDADGTITNYVWSENGGTIGAGIHPQVTLAVGTHTITLTVTDNLGATNSDTVIVTVVPPVIAIRPGDCNADHKIDAGDISALTLEIFDGDGTNPANTGGGSFAGNPTGCNANQDTTVDAGDLSCTTLLIFNSEATCAVPRPN